MSYTTRVYIEDRSWKVIACLFASNPKDLIDFLEGPGCVHEAPKDLSAETLDRIDIQEEIWYWDGAAYMRAYHEYYRKRPLRRIFKRKYVETIMDIIAWFIVEEAHCGGRVICERSF